MYLLSIIKTKFKDIIFVYQYTQVVRYICSFLISIIMVKSALPALDLGQYEIFIFIAASLSIFWSGGIKNAMFSYYPQLNENEKALFPLLVFYLLLGLSVIVAGIVFFFPALIVAFFSFDSGILYLPYLSVYLIFSIPLAVIESNFYLKNDVKKLLTYTHWSQIGGLLIMLSGAICSPHLFSFILLLIAINLLRFIFLLYTVFKEPGYFFDWSKVKVFFIFSMPLIANMLLGSAMDIVDGWFVTRFFDPSYFPIYKYGARELPLSSLLFSSLSIAMVPIIMQHGVRTDAIKIRATKLMHWLFPASALLMILAPLVFPIVYNETYKDSAFVFNIYLLILTSRVLLPQSFCLALHQHSIVIWSGVFEIIVNILLSYWWMHSWGIFGLAMGTVVAYFIQKLILIFYNQWKNKIAFDHYIDLKYYLFYTSSLVLIFFISWNYL